MIQFCTPNQKNKIKQLLIKNISNDSLKTKESLEQMIVNVANIQNFKFEHVADDKDIVTLLKSILPEVDLSNKDGSIIPYANIVTEIKSYSIDDLFYKIPSAKAEFEGYSTRMFLGRGILGVNKNSEYSLDNKSLNENFSNLKGELFEKIQKFLRNKGYYTGNIIPLFDSKGVVNYKAYSNIMNLLSGYFYNPGNFTINRSSEGKAIPDLDGNLNNRRDVFEAYYNMIILSNFDSIIATKFNSFFKVNINKFNQLNSKFADVDKYSLVFDPKTTAYWSKGDHESESSEGRIDDFTKKLITLIPRYNKQGGKTSEYMEVNDFYLIAAVISEFELKYGNKLRNNLKNSNGFNYFNTNGVEMFKWYLKEIKDSIDKKPGSLPELSVAFGIIYDKILSIDKFINNSEYNIAEKELNSGNSIINFMSQVINNNYGANYSTYTHNGDYKVQEMYNQDFNSTRVQSTLFSTMKMNFANSSFYDLKSDKELNLFNSLFPKNIDTIENFYTAVERNEINHNKLNKYIKSKTGINMTKSSLLSAIYDIESYDGIPVTGTSFKNALYNLINAINNDFKDSKFKTEISNSTNDGKIGLDSTIGSFLTNAINEQLFVALKNAFAEKFSIRAVMNVKSADGNTLPTFKVSNLTYKDAELFEQQREYELNTSGNLHKSLLILDQHAIDGTITKLEVLGKNRSKAFDKLSVAEQFQSDFQYDFIENAIKNNKFSVIIGNYSDKSTILAKLINGNFSINEGKNILEENIETILEKVRTQGYNYYYDSVTKVVSDYKILMDFLGYENTVNTNITSDLNNSISQIEDFLSIYKITDLVKVIADEQLRTGKDLGMNLIEELHYSNYSNGVKMNSFLLDNFRIYSSPNLFNQFVQATEKSALSKISDNSFKINNTESMLTRFNLKKSDFADIVEVKGVQKETFSYGKIVFNNGNINPLFKKWLWLNSLFRNEYLFISTKGEYMHPHKIRNNFNSRSGNFSEEGYWNNYFLDMSKRLSSMAKRNVTNTASIEVPVRKSIKGISENVIIAAIEDHRDNIYTTSGHMKHGNRSQDVHDGASYIDAVYSRMLDASFPGKGYSGTKKQFGTLITPNGVTIKKDAESVITNARIRNSLNSSISLLNMKRRMLSIPINETINYISKDLTDYYIYQDGKRQQLKKLLLDTKPSGEIVATITYSEGNWNAAQQRFIYAKESSRTVNINNLYDLWLAIGGYHTIDIEGNFNERSNDFLYDIITEVKGVDAKGNETENRVLKEKIIHVLSNHSALKAGATNLNSREAWKNGNINLAYSKYKSRFMGPQLDASHDADDSDIREVSQVISAVSQGGYTSELAEEIYNDIAEVIKASVKKYSVYLDDGKVKDKEKLYRVLSNKFVDAIQKSDRDEVTKALIDSLKSNGVNIPISSQHFYNLFIRDVVTTLNNEFITRRYPGLGGVLIPSQGIIQLYDIVNKDGEWITATQEDLMKDALEQHSMNRRAPKGLSNEQIFRDYIINNLKNVKTFVGEIELGDKVISNGQEYDLSNIIEYYKFKETHHLMDVVEKVVGVPRDLKPTLHKFKTNIISPDTGQTFLVTKNLFDLQPLKLLYKRNIGKSDNINILTESEAELLTYIESFTDDVDVFLRAWLQRTYELLDKNLIMPEITIENIETIFGNDNLLGDVLTDVLPMYSEISNEIFDLQFQPAEIVMADIYKSNFARDDNTSMYDIYKKGHLYFKEKLLNLYNTEDSTEADLKILTEDSSNPLYIKFVAEFSKYSNVNLKINPDSHEGLKSRYDEMGNKLYDVSNRFTINPYLDSTGKEIIEVKLTNDPRETKRTIRKLISSVKGMRSVIPLNYNNTLVTEGKRNKAITKMLNKKIQHLMSLYNLNDLKASTFEYFTDENLNNYDLSSSNWFEQNKDSILESIATNMYVSWKHSHNKVASRIPAQSMQSFMPMKNAAYIMDGSNDVYVNVHQIFLQGSDFDIDKAYILGNGFSSLGKMDLWTNISNYNSQETLNALLELPIPTGKTINIKLGNTSGVDSILEELYQSFAISLGDTGLTRNLSVDSLKILNEIIRYVNDVVKHNPDGSLFLFENELVNLPIEDFKNLINKHNTYVNYRRGNNSLKNSVTHKINKIISTPSNQLNANIPVDVDILHDAAERSEEKRGVVSNDTNLNSSDMLSYYQQQYNASVGKDDVGIFANGMKGLLALTSYYNNYYKNILGINEEAHKIRQSNKTFKKYYTWTNDFGELKTFKMGSISDVQISKSQEQKLKEILGDDYKKLNRNAIIIMSSLISAATDNAKELIMAKINASVELASMHAYMVTMGFNLDDIVEFMTSDAAQLIINSSQDNIYKDDYPKNILKEIQKLKKQKHSPEIASQLHAFEQIYKDSKEFSALTGLLGINQKRKADTWEMFNYLNRFTKLMNDGKSIYKLSKSVKENLDNNTNEKKIGKKTNYVDKTEFINITMENNTTLDKNSNLDRYYVGAVYDEITRIRLSDGSITNMLEFFNINHYLHDKNYQEAAKKLYNLVKRTFNIFDIIEEVPHFAEMINSLKMSHIMIRDLSSSYNFTMNYLVTILNEESGRLNNSNSNHISKKNLLKGTDYFNHMVTRNWLKTEGMEKFVFNVSDLLKLTNTKSITLYKSNKAMNNPNEVIDVNKDDNFIISLDTDYGIANFKKVMEELLLPYLQILDKSDALQNLRVETVTNTFGLKTNAIISAYSINSLNSSVGIHQFNEILKAFNDLDTNYNTKNQIKNSLHENLKWKDLFYIYNLIVNDNKIGDKRLTSLFRDYNNELDSLAISHAEYFNHVDESLEDFLKSDLTNDPNYELAENKKELEDKHEENMINTLLFYAFQERGFLSGSNDLKINNITNSDFVIISNVVENSDDSFAKLKEILNKVDLGGFLIEYKC